MGELVKGISYANFRAWVPRKKLPIGSLETHTWLYYDWGPREYSEPLVFLHAAAGAADVFFEQVLEMGSRGYRVLTVDLPVYWTVAEFCDAFHLFLDSLHLQKIHLFGAGLGGFLAMMYAAQRPERIGSLMLTHSFVSTKKIHKPLPQGPGVIRWLPDFVVKRAMLSLLPKGRAELRTALAAEFIIARVQQATTHQLATRLALLCSTDVIPSIKLADDRITIIDAIDRDNRAGEEASHEILEVFPRARVAYVKTGGEFVYLSNPAEVNVHVVVHMRRQDAPTPQPPTRLPPQARARITDPAEVRKLKEAAREDHLSPNFKYIKDLQVLKAAYPDADVHMLASAVAAFKGDSDIVQRLISDGAIRRGWKGPISPAILDKLRAKETATTPARMRTEVAISEDEDHSHSHDYIARGPAPFQPSTEAPAAEKPTTASIAATEEAEPVHLRKPAGPERFAPVEDDDEENPLLIVAERALHEATVNESSIPERAPAEHEYVPSESLIAPTAGEQPSANFSPKLPQNNTEKPVSTYAPPLPPPPPPKPRPTSSQLKATTKDDKKDDDPWRRYRNVP